MVVTDDDEVHAALACRDDDLLHRLSNGPGVVRVETRSLDALTRAGQYGLELGRLDSGIIVAGLSSSVPKFCGPSGLSDISSTASTTRSALVLRASSIARSRALSAASRPS